MGRFELNLGFFFFCIEMYRFCFVVKIWAWELQKHLDVPFAAPGEGPIPWGASEPRAAELACALIPWAGNQTQVKNRIKEPASKLQLE